MMKLTSFKILLGLVFLSTTFFTSTTAVVCPPWDEISPCVCLEPLGPGKLEIQCLGYIIFQEVIDGVFSALRHHNNLTLHETLPLTGFRIRGTDLSTLDLTPFLYSRIKALQIFENPYLSSIVGPSTSVDDHPEIQPTAADRLIDVEQLVISDTNLTLAGVVNLTSHLTNNLTTFMLTENNNLMAEVDSLSSSSSSFYPWEDKNTQVFASPTEFIPNLSFFTNIEGLNLEVNRIQRVRSGAFKISDRLELLDFTNNRIAEIEENAFDFENESRYGDLGTKGQKSPILSLVFTGNRNLTEKAIHVNSGLAHSKSRGIALILSSCSLESLPRQIFEPFLDAQVENMLFVNDNPLLCDARVKWAKDRRKELEPRIYEPFCINDPGHTIFNSSLVA